MADQPNGVLDEKIAGLRRELDALRAETTATIYTVEENRKDQTKTHAEAHAALHAAQAKADQDITKTSKDTRDDLRTEMQRQVQRAEIESDRRSADMIARIDRSEMALDELKRWRSNMEGKFWALGALSILIPVVLFFIGLATRGGI